MNPQAIMKGIIETLGELDTVSSRQFMIKFNLFHQTFVVKSPNFRIKCFRKIGRKTSQNSDIDIEMYDKDGQDGETVDQANPKNDKFTTNELIFALQIYAVIFSFCLIISFFI